LIYPTLEKLEGPSSLDKDGTTFLNMPTAGSSENTNLMLMNPIVFSADVIP